MCNVENSFFRVRADLAGPANVSSEAKSGPFVLNT